ncbi:MAG: hypothetical protein HOC72_19925, partial [Rhodospirillaceae bacterium]|nr:hypothetical protein [Rhodospirillaceae bacterium]
GFHPGDDPGEDDPPAATVVLIGNAGPALWRCFPGPNGNRDALDDWCRQVLPPLAHGLGADILFPFDGPPYQPFQRWARRAEGLPSSPIGPLIHPEYGLWHAYRGALLFQHKMALPPPLNINPCGGCVEKPCLTTCPAAAFSADAYDVPACVDHLKQPEGDVCLSLGCRARRACPIGQAYLYEPAQANFHMAAFRRNY